MILQIAKLILAIPQLFEIFLKIKNAIEESNRANQHNSNTDGIDAWVRGDQTKKPGS